MSDRTLLALSTQGMRSLDHERMLELLRDVQIRDISQDLSGPRHRALITGTLIRAMRRGGGRALFMEGTGIAGGLAALYGRFRLGIPYVVSTGDAVGPWVRARSRFLWPLFSVYEYLLFRYSAGVIGWSPYLVGRALTMGAPRGVAVPGWAKTTMPAEQRSAARQEIREQLGIDADAIVIGIAGSLVWNPRVGYCYGIEIVRAMQQVKRNDVYALILGDGSGLDHVRTAVDRAGSSSRVKVVGRVPRGEVPRYLAAMDIGSLPQTLDNLGMHRYTTKIVEYVAAELPMATSRVPAAFDLDTGWIWRIPGETPWSEEYVRGLAELLEKMASDELEAKAKAVKAVAATFDENLQRQRIRDFLHETLGVSIDI